MKRNLLFVIALLIAGLIGQSLSASQLNSGQFGGLSLVFNNTDYNNGNYVYTAYNKANKVVDYLTTVNPFLSQYYGMPFDQANILTMASVITGNRYDKNGLESGSYNNVLYGTPMKNETPKDKANYFIKIITQQSGHPLSSSTITGINAAIAKAQ